MAPKGRPAARAAGGGLGVIKENEVLTVELKGVDDSGKPRKYRVEMIDGDNNTATLVVRLGEGGGGGSTFALTACACLSQPVKPTTEEEDDTTYDQQLDDLSFTLSRAVAVDLEDDAGAGGSGSKKKKKLSAAPAAVVQTGECSCSFWLDLFQLRRRVDSMTGT